jgi:hypothetical protein
MAKSKRAVFLDTNILLHYTFFPEVTWNDLAGCEEVVLVICPVTLGELDKQKYSNPSSRVKERARKVGKKLEELLDSGGFVRQGVSMEFIHIEPNEFERYQLSRASQDDQLLASILKYRSDHSHSDVLLVTNDIGLKLKSKARDIATMKLPDSYRLEEPDPHEKKAKELERRILALQARLPALKLDFKDGLDRFEFFRPSTTPNENDFIKRGIETIKSIHTKMEIPAGLRNALDLLSSVPTSEISEYNESLDEFFELYELYLSTSFKIEDLRARSVSLRFKLNNFGTAPAEDVRVFIKFRGDVTVGTASQLFALPRKPNPPKKPKPRSWASFPSYDHLRPFAPVPNLGNILKAEPVIWHGIEKEDSGWVASFEVRKLNHGYSEDCPRPLHVVFSTVDSMRSFQVEYEVTAGNIPEKSRGILHGVLKSIL